jgi:hypothetical protein
MKKFCQYVVNTFLATYIKYTKLVFLTSFTPYSIHNPDRAIGNFYLHYNAHINYQYRNSGNGARGESHFKLPLYTEWAMDDVWERQDVYVVFWYSTVALNLLMFFLELHLIFVNILSTIPIKLFIFHY